ncbi:MAG: hypothetical protein HY834_14295 [Devosia nanyangense]|uniref:C-type lysozyme inhibitor domain-containing protein n=1 Tax=Devosia nanyangense TaxID=1228055 RepID=A0A933L286_9HYPH|nr:hypothetical protein [Devosia nanyangense]
MRLSLALCLVLVVSPALAQFPPPGVYGCTSEAGDTLGVLSLLVAGDYQWDADGVSVTGQVASAGTGVEALTGPLAGQHWSGDFSTELGETVFVFSTDIGKVTCR